MIDSELWVSPLSLPEEVSDANPVMNLDPSGRMSLASVGGAMVGMAVLASIGTSFNMNSGYVVSNGVRRWDLWDAVAMTALVARTASIPQVATTSAKQRKPTDGHHTIPKYLWGVDEQDTVEVPIIKHGIIHFGLSKLQVEIQNAETYANERVKFGWFRKGSIKQLCQTEQGRIGITNAIEVFNRTLLDLQWDEAREINNVFYIERDRYVGGKTTCLP